jgi:hypothetical protein
MVATEGRQDAMPKTIRRSISMTPEMRDRLMLLASKQPRDTTEADIIRDAIRAYLDNQADIIGSRKHFQKSLQARVDLLEEGVAFHLNVLIYLVAALAGEGRDELIAEALVTAKREGETLLAQMNKLRSAK